MPARALPGVLRTLLASTGSQIVSSGALNHVLYTAVSDEAAPLVLYDCAPGFQDDLAS